jgi:hypothetical protein
LPPGSATAQWRCRNQAGRLPRERERRGSLLIYFALSKKTSHVHGGAVVPIITNHPHWRLSRTTLAGGRSSRDSHLSESLIFNPDPSRQRTLVGIAQMTPRRIRMTTRQRHRPTCMAGCHLEPIGIDWWDLQRLRFQLATRPWFCWGGGGREEQALAVGLRKSCTRHPGASLLS